MMHLDFDSKKGLAQIDGHVNFEKFAVSNAIDPADDPIDLWNRDHNLTYLETAVPFYATSSNAADTQPLVFITIKKDWEISACVVNLTGQTPVLLSPTESFLRCFRVVNLGTTETAGDVYVSTGAAGWTLGIPNDTADIQAFSGAADQQTLMSHLSLPYNYWGLIKIIQLGIINDGNTVATNADIRIRTRTSNGILGDGVFLTKGVYPVNSGGTSTTVIKNPSGTLVAPKTDIKFVVSDVGRSATRISCTYVVEFFRTDRIRAPIIEVVGC